MRLLFFLGVDLAVNCLADGAHYCSIWAPGTFAPGDYYAPLVPDIVFMLTTIIARTAVRRGPASATTTSTTTSSTTTFASTSTTSTPRTARPSCRWPSSSS